MASRKARPARFVGVAASSFRDTVIAGFLGIAVLSSPVSANPPITGLGTGTGLGGAGGALGAGTAVPAAAAPRTIWGFLGLSPASLQACRDKLLACQLGQMANSLLTGPVGAISGGMICPLCPPAPTPGQIAGAGEEAEWWRGGRCRQDQGERSRCEGAGRRRGVSWNRRLQPLPARRRKGSYRPSGKTRTSACGSRPPGR